MNDSSNICLSCGLCCDGSLIGFVQVENEEVSSLSKLMEIEDSKDFGVFLQPCSNYCNGCSIYANRPKQCASFKCGLLKSLEQKEIDFDVAIESISQVKQKKIDLEEKIETLNIKLKAPSFYFKMIELKKLLQKIEAESSLSQKHLDLKSDQNKLDNLLLSKFNLS